MKMIGRFEEVKATRIVFFCLRAFIMLFLLAIIIWSVLGPSSKEITLKSDLAEYFNGKIDTLYRDTRNHNVLIAALSKRWLFSVPAEWETKLEIGDSISKSSGSLKIYVYRKNKKPIVLDYKDIIKE